MIIGTRFCGPPDSGNGGYAAGLLASQLGSGPVEVTLRRPPPLERELAVSVEGGLAKLEDGQALIAEARRATLSAEPPPAPSFERAQELSSHYIGHTKHHFPACFVCGPARAVGDGLRIFPGAEHAGDAAAAPFVPDANLAGEDGFVRSEFLWAALDCVGYFAIAAPDYPVALLGRITAEITGKLRPHERSVVVGWPLSREGRKLRAGTALYGPDGRVCGRAEQTWILLA
jgi:hypothetical protein